MKNILNSAIGLCVCMILLVKCKDAEIKPGEFHLTKMKDIQTSSSGAELIAEIISEGTSPITRIGFIWSEGLSIDSASLYIKESDSDPGSGIFSATVTSDLTQGQIYTVKPFIQTEKNLIIGDFMRFKGEGSKPPVIHDFFPKNGLSGDTITLVGDNFSHSLSRIKVKVGNDQTIVISTDGKIIKFFLPRRLGFGEVPLTLISGEFEIYGDDFFHVP